MRSLRSLGMSMARAKPVIQAASLRRRAWTSSQRRRRRLISMAGTLGFDRLSQACRALQDACAAGRRAASRPAREAGDAVRRWRPAV
ncbi:Hpt domain-containing protein [Methylobacterium trifolii]|uniref:Hpt domain-containing protein n=1 Tax=Methylobacterium trifolii TaxID=1003092 RepID=UPI001EDE66A4|nr:Hpt domain-containing protein [Methylobacterium trifolii]